MTCAADDGDDLPQTHLDDDAYDEFVKREFDGAGRVRAGPRVGLILFILVVIVLAIAFLKLR
jgi:hypothetical protein